MMYAVALSKSAPYLEIIGPVNSCLGRIGTLGNTVQKAPLAFVSNTALDYLPQDQLLARSRTVLNECPSPTSLD